MKYKLDMIKVHWIDNIIIQKNFTSIIKKLN